MRYRWSYLVLFLGLVLSAGIASAQERPVEVYILAGQSNMVGQGRVAELPDSLRTVPGNVTFYDRRERSSFTDGDWFGPEVTFARTLSRSQPEHRILLVKFAVGGTSLLAWAPDWSEEQAARTDNAEAGPLYDRLLKQVRGAIEGRRAQLAGLLWMQGERDARYPVAGTDYRANFTTFVERLRADLDAPDLPVVLGQVNPPPARYPAAEEVRAAQTALGREMNGVITVSTEGLTKHDDDLHYDTAGQLELGRRMARVYLENLAP